MPGELDRVENQIKIENSRSGGEGGGGDGGAGGRREGIGMERESNCAERKS